MKNLIYLGIISLFIIACSRKSSGITSRTYHRITAWNNTTFNGKEAFVKQMKGKEEAYIDNFSEVLKVEPIDFIDPNQAQYQEEEQALSFMKKTSDSLASNEQSSGTGFDKTIAKSLKAIDKHSIEIKGKEYNSMLGDAYLLMGRAYLSKNEPFKAIDAYTTMQKKMVKSNKLNASKVYLAEANHITGNDFEAGEQFLELTNTKLKKRDKKLVSKKYSQFLIDTQKPAEAIAALEVASKYNKSNRGRYSFIQGQLYEKIGENNKAVERYQNAFKKTRDFNIEVNAILAEAKLFDPKSSNFEELEKKLLQLTKKGTYKSLKNSVYLGLGQLSEKIDSSAKAEKYYQLALNNKSDNSGSSLGQVYLAMADLKYKKSDYFTASLYYDSATSKINDNVLVEKIRKRNDKLKILITNYKIVKKNDSIIAIYKLPQEEKIKYYNNHITKIKEEEERQRKLIENQNYINSTGGGTSPSKSSKTGDFYFYNQAAKIQGIQEFKQLWGDRVLTDNWRLVKNQSVVNDVAKGLDASKTDTRKYDVNYYINQLPKTDAEVQKLKEERDKAELALGLTYYDDFQDNQLGTKTLDHLISTPPYSEDITTQALYNLYIMNKENDLANKYKNQLLTKYANSKYANSILNPVTNNPSSAKKNIESENLYIKAYEAYQNKDYAQVRSIATNAVNLFPNDKIMAKFALLNALTDAKEGKMTNYKESLERIILMFENSDEAKKAQELLKSYNQLKSETK